MRTRSERRTVGDGLVPSRFRGIANARRGRGRVAEGGRPPPAPTDPDVRDSRIRLLGLWCSRAIGASARFAVGEAGNGGTAAGSGPRSSASFPCRVEMFTELGGPSIFPSESPTARSAASLRRVPGGGFPGLAGTIRGLRLLAARPAALRSPSLGGTTSCALFAPSGTGTPRGRDCCLPRPSVPPSPVETTRPPRFLGDPCPHAPLSDPGGTPDPRTVPAPAVVPSALVTASASAMFTDIVARSRGLQGSLCTLRSRGRPRTTQHSVPAGRSTLAGQDSHLLGRREGFRHVATWHPPSPGFAWRKTSPAPVRGLTAHLGAFRRDGLVPSRREPAAMPCTGDRTPELSR